MAAFLTADERGDLEWVVEWLTNMNGPAGAHVDEKTAHQLSEHYVKFGYTSQLEFLDEIHDNPVATLVRVILHLDTL